MGLAIPIIPLADEVAFSGSAFHVLNASKVWVCIARFCRVVLRYDAT